MTVSTLTNKNSLTKLQESILKQNIKQNLLLFTEWMGYTNAPFHTTWYSLLQYKFSPIKDTTPQLKKYLQLWPRGHGKTTGIILYCLWLIGNYHDINIQIVSKTASQAETINTALMSMIEHDKRYNSLFGSLKPSNPTRWTASQFIVARQEISKNPTCKASGLMGPITGGRNDLIICDDIIDEENVRTRVQLEKVSTWFNKVLYPTMFPWGGIIVIGTRWSYADLYAELIDKWPHSVLAAIQPDQSVLWPEYWPINKLLERRKEIGSIIFDCQYQNDPTGMEGSLLKAEWLHAWEHPPLNTGTTYAGIDPALGEGDKQGIAIMTVNRGGGGEALLREVWADTVPFPTFLQKIKQMATLYRVSKIYVESNAFQKILITVPELRGLPMVPTATTHDKESRFIAMSSHFEAKRILINPLLNSSKSEFWNEWVQFPRGQYDDALDAVEIVARNVVGRPRGRIII